MLHIVKHISITQNQVKVDGNTVFTHESEEGFNKFIRGVYRHFKTDYPKFFKMDPLSKLGFISVEVLLKGLETDISGPRTACILFNSSSSLEIDEKHQESIRDRENYFPSPSNFVYTLPNIMAGEAAIRHKFLGENTVLINDSFDVQLIYDMCLQVFISGLTDRCICGWVEQYENKYESLLFLVERYAGNDEGKTEDVIFEPSILLKTFKQEI
jgi:hypothetical protein